VTVATGPGAARSARAAARSARAAARSAGAAAGAGHRAIGPLSEVTEKALPPVSADGPARTVPLADSGQLGQAAGRLRRR
jgi:hypothetical protein